MRQDVVYMGILNPGAEIQNVLLRYDDLPAADIELGVLDAVLTLQGDFEWLPDNVFVPWDGSILKQTGNATTAHVWGTLEVLGEVIQIDLDLFDIPGSSALTEFRGVGTGLEWTLEEEDEFGPRRLQIGSSAAMKPPGFVADLGTFGGVEFSIEVRPLFTDPGPIPPVEVTCNS